jgi:hypothetical protein
MSKDIINKINKINEINEIINNKIDIIQLEVIVKKCINSAFINLIIDHKNLIINNLLKVVKYTIYYFNIENNNSNIENYYVEQFLMNNNQDIYSLLTLLMPYYDLNKSKSIQRLDEIFTNYEDKAKDLSSSYYVDHYDKINLSEGILKKYLENYFDNSVLSIINTLDKVSSKLLPNWKNIFPYTMKNYKDSNKYKYYIDILNNKEFDNNNSGYFYSVIYKFLYIDIKDIKWMIFDYKDSNKTITPYIIILCNKLKINNLIIHKSWEKLDINIQNELINEWINFTKSNYFDIIKSLILFYLRWEYDQNKLSKFEIVKDCNSIIKKKIEDNLKYDNDTFEEEKILGDNDIKNCIQKFIDLNLIDFKNIYNYIYESIQQFKYTWYGLNCLDDNQNILHEDIFFENYKNKYLSIYKINSDYKEEKSISNYRYPTLKNIYNFFKSLLHSGFRENDKKIYKMISKSYEWDNIDENNKKVIIDRLNMNNIKEWFNINTNLLRIYDSENAKIIYTFIVDMLYDEKKIVDIVFETLVYNGMLTYFRYNPKITDNNAMPNKNREYKKWENHILDNLNLDEYKDSYHFFSNKKYSHEYSDEFIDNNKSKDSDDKKNKSDIFNSEKKINSLEIIKNSKWYNNFGSDWIAQIQLYHHYLNNRILYITGATGAGKSTVAPFALLYAVKMLNYNNNAKIVCTVPRIQPAEDNSKQMSVNIGISINNNNPINYIQFETQNKKITDNLYHPKLILATDGLLYQRIKSNYVIKNKVNDRFLSTNMYDMILVDEAHEHNVYMDMILTLCKFGVYINNQVSLGIISATMDSDELIYRKYFEIINDNMKWPLNVVDNYDRVYLDRRIHLSVPFGGMNFDVKEIDRIGFRPEDVVKEIIKNTTNGDILLFLPGRAEIIKAIKEINSITPNNVLAIPFYSELNQTLLERVKDIGEKETRKLFRYPKDKDIEDMDKILREELLPENTYTRFIIVATNIAEASITINTLEYVVDTGTQKINRYNINKDGEELKSEIISKPNKTQRKGRVGRVKPGKFYYTYDINKLNLSVIFKICIQNIQDILFSLYKINNTNTEDYKNINENTDPNIITDKSKMNKLEFLIEQYLLSNGEMKENNKIVNNKLNKIIYPDNDGRYDYNTLIDKEGKFYIIHPDEDKFKRDIDLNIKIINPDKYVNKVERMFENGKTSGFIDEKNNITDNYKLLENTQKITTKISDKITIKHIRLMYDLLINNYDIDSEIVNKIVLFILFSTESYRLDINKKITGNADYLIQASIIPNYLYEFTDYNILNIDTNNKNLSNIKLLVKNYIDKKLKNNTNIKEDLKRILMSFYNIKLCFKILTNNDQKLLLEKDIKDTNSLYKKIKSKNENEINIKHYLIYDQICYFIIKNFQSNLLVKISESDYYVNYKNIDINELYLLNKRDSKVSSKNINRIILALNLSDPIHIRNIMWIPDYLTEKLKIKKSVYNNKIDFNELKKNYDTNYNIIIQKIDKVSKYIKEIR